MKRGNLRWDEAAFAEHSTKRARFQRGGEVIDTEPPAPPLYPLVALCRTAGLPEPVPEYQFHPTRKWRFDYAWPLRLFALEVDGGVWTQGRHTRGAGRLADMEKQSEAALAGWRVLYVQPRDLRTVGMGYLFREFSDAPAVA